MGTRQVCFPSTVLLFALTLILFPPSEAVVGRSVLFQREVSEFLYQEFNCTGSNPGGGWTWIDSETPFPLSGGGDGNAFPSVTCYWNTKEAFVYATNPDPTDIPGPTRVAIESLRIDQFGEAGAQLVSVQFDDQPLTDVKGSTQGLSNETELTIVDLPTDISDTKWVPNTALKITLEFEFEVGVERGGSLANELIINDMGFNGTLQVTRSIEGLRDPTDPSSPATNFGVGDNLGIYGIGLSEVIGVAGGTYQLKLRFCTLENVCDERLMQARPEVLPPTLPDGTQFANVTIPPTICLTPNDFYTISLSDSSPEGSVIDSSNLTLSCAFGLVDEGNDDIDDIDDDDDDDDDDDASQIPIWAIPLAVVTSAIGVLGLLAMAFGRPAKAPEPEPPFKAPLKQLVPERLNSDFEFESVNSDFESTSVRTVATSSSAQTAASEVLPRVRRADYGPA